MKSDAKQNAASANEKEQPMGCKRAKKVEMSPAPVKAGEARVRGRDATVLGN